MNPAINISDTARISRWYEGGASKWYNGKSTLPFGIDRNGALLDTVLVEVSVDGVKYNIRYRIGELRDMDAFNAANFDLEVDADKRLAPVEGNLRAAFDQDKRVLVQTVGHRYLNFVAQRDNAPRVGLAPDSKSFELQMEDGKGLKLVTDANMPQSIAEHTLGRVVGKAKVPADAAQRKLTLADTDNIQIVKDAYAAAA